MLASFSEKPARPALTGARPCGMPSMPPGVMARATQPRTARGGPRSLNVGFLKVHELQQEVISRSNLKYKPRCSNFKSSHRGHLR